MTDKEKTEAPAAEQTPESSEAPTEVAAAETPTLTEEPTQAASEDSGTKPTGEDVKADATANDDVPQDKPADRVVPDIGDYVLPEGAPQGLAEFANQADMTQDQLNLTLQQFGSIVQQSEHHKQAQLRASGEKHVESWGAKKDYNLSVVRRALKQNDPEGKLKEMLDNSGLGNHPEVLNFFLSVGTSMREGGFLKGANNNQTKAGMSTAQSMFGGSHPSNN